MAAASFYLDWLSKIAPGDEVATTYDYKVRRVNRLTRTQIILDGEMPYRRKDGRGVGYEYESSSLIYTVDPRIGQHRQLMEAKREAESAVRACEDIEALRKATALLK